MPTMRLSPEDEAKLLSTPGVTMGPSVRLPESTPSVSVDADRCAKVQARGRTQPEPGKMNQTEQAYAEVLEARRRAGEIAGFWFEGIKFRLADRTYYTPDFLVILANGAVELHEVKGFMREDAAVKLKAIASQFWPFIFRLVKRSKKQWTEEVISSN